ADLRSAAPPWPPSPHCCVANAFQQGTCPAPPLRRNTFLMRVPARLAILCAAVCLTAASAFSDEIRLKDGKKLYGVIVAYEDNMFKIKTDFGFVLVEKDKIASIIPTTPASSTPVPGTSGLT